MLNKVLRLERPLAVLDLETTGLNNSQDRIIQIALTIHYPHREPIPWTSLVNPGIPIKEGAPHGITENDVKDAPAFKTIGPVLAPKITNVDIAGYNVEFDIGFMRAEMARCGVLWDWNGHVVDAMHLFRKFNGHTLTNAYKRYVDPKGFKDAHDAGKDVEATEAVLLAQLNEHQDLPRSVKDLSEVCFPRKSDGVDRDGRFIWVGPDVVCNFGKHKGKKLKSMPSEYLEWMATGGSFSPEVTTLVTDALNGKLPVRK